MIPSEDYGGNFWVNETSLFLSRDLDSLTARIKPRKVARTHNVHFTHTQTLTDTHSQLQSGDCGIKGHENSTQKDPGLGSIRNLLQDCQKLQFELEK